MVLRAEVELLTYGRYSCDGQQVASVMTALAFIYQQLKTSLSKIKNKSLIVKV